MKNPKVLSEARALAKQQQRVELPYRVVIAGSKAKRPATITRSKIVEMVNATNALEGVRMSPRLAAQVAEYRDGKKSIEQLIAETKAQYAIG